MQAWKTFRQATEEEDNHERVLFNSKHQSYWVEVDRDSKGYNSRPLIMDPLIFLQQVLQVHTKLGLKIPFRDLENLMPTIKLKLRN